MTQDPWVASGVLVETFEPGESVERYIRNPQPFNTQVAVEHLHLPAPSTEAACQFSISLACVGHVRLLCTAGGRHEH